MGHYFLDIHLKRCWILHKISLAGSYTILERKLLYFLNEFNDLEYFVPVNLHFIHTCKKIDLNITKEFSFSFVHFLRKYFLMAIFLCRRNYILVEARHRRTHSIYDRTYVVLRRVVSRISGIRPDIEISIQLDIWPDHS